MHYRKKKTKKYLSKKSKSKKSKTKKCSKLVGSVCSSISTLKASGKSTGKLLGTAAAGRVAGINEYTQLTINGPLGQLYGKGVQLWGPGIAQGYAKNFSWNSDPKNFQLQSWKLNRLGGGELDKYLPKGKLKAHGKFKIIDAGGKFAHTKGQKGNFAAAFSPTGEDFMGISCVT